MTLLYSDPLYLKHETGRHERRAKFPYLFADRSHIRPMPPDCPIPK